MGHVSCHISCLRFDHVSPRAASVRLLLLLLLVVLPRDGVFPPEPAHAAAITVTTTDDENNVDGDCSLREAIIAANSDTAVDGCAAGNGLDTIFVPAGNYVLTLAGNNDNDALTGDLDIRDDVTIMGEGRLSTIVDAAGLDRVFDLHFPAERVEISRLTIRGGT